MPTGTPSKTGVGSGNQRLKVYRWKLAPARHDQILAVAVKICPAIDNVGGDSGGRGIRQRYALFQTKASLPFRHTEYCVYALLPSQANSPGVTCPLRRSVSRESDKGIAMMRAAPEFGRVQTIGVWLAVAFLIPVPMLQADDALVTAAPNDATPQSSTGTLRGSITWKGDIPDEQLAARLPGGIVVPNDSLVIDEKSRGIANVFLYFFRLADGVQVPAAPKEPVELSILGSRFEPHVLALRTGQDLKVTNDERTPRNFHTNPLRNDAVNRLIDSKGSFICQFPKQEKFPIAATDDLIPFMKAWLHPVDHPWFAVTDSRGHFEIRDIPAGTHELLIWHESIGIVVPRLSLEIVAGETSTLTREFTAETLVNKGWRPGIGIPHASIGPFDLSAPGNGDDVQLGRSMLERTLNARLDAIDRACSLTGVQRTKLTLAAKRDIELLLEQVQQLRAEYLQFSNEPKQIADLLKNRVQPLRLRWKTGPFEADTMFGKTLHNTLTPDQQAQWDAVHTR